MARLTGKSLSIMLLQLLTWSKTPLPVEAVIDFLAVNTEAQLTDNRTDRKPSLNEIMRSISSPVTIVTVEETKMSSKSTSSSLQAASTVGTTSELRLAHPSVREYLTSDRLEEPFRSQLSKLPAAECIARMTLTHLLRLDTEPSFKDLESRSPFAQYAAENWMHSAKLAESQPGDHKVKELVLQMLSTPRVFAAWLRLYDPDVRPRFNSMLDTRGSPQPLYYVSLGGFEDIVSALIAEGADVHTRGGYYGNALQAACAEGHHSVVMLLLSKDANANAQGGCYGNALQAACERGHETIAWALLEAGAEVNAPGQLYISNALQAASRSGQESLVKELIDRGANVDTMGGAYDDLLLVAHDASDNGTPGYGTNGSLLSHTGSHNNELQTFSETGPTELGQTLLGNGVQTVTASAAGAAAGTSTAVIGAAAVGATGAIGGAIALISKLVLVDIPTHKLAVENERDKTNAELQKGMESSMNCIKMELESLKLLKENFSQFEGNLRKRSAATNAIRVRYQDALDDIHKQQKHLNEKMEVERCKRQAALMRSQDLSELLNSKDRELQACCAEVVSMSQELGNLQRRQVHAASYAGDDEDDDDDDDDDGDDDEGDGEDQDVPSASRNMHNSSIPRTTPPNHHDLIVPTHMRCPPTSVSGHTQYDPISEHDTSTTMLRQDVRMLAQEKEQLSESMEQLRAEHLESLHQKDRQIRRQIASSEGRFAALQKELEDLKEKQASSKQKLCMLAPSHKNLRLWKTDLQGRCDQLSAQLEDSRNNQHVLMQSHEDLMLSNSDLQARCDGLLAQTNVLMTKNDQTREQTTAKSSLRDRVCLSCRVCLSKIEMHVEHFGSDDRTAERLETVGDESNEGHTTCGHWHHQLHKVAAILELAHVESCSHGQRPQDTPARATKGVQGVQGRPGDAEEQLNTYQILEPPALGTGDDNELSAMLMNDTENFQDVLDGESSRPRNCLQTILPSSAPDSETRNKLRLSRSSESVIAPVGLDQPDSPSGSSFALIEEPGKEAFHMHTLRRRESFWSDDL